MHEHEVRGEAEEDYRWSSRLLALPPATRRRSPRGWCGACACCGFVELVATPPCRYLPTREGPLRRGEPIARQPGRGLVVAVNLVVVPSGYTYRRPKPPRTAQPHSLAFWVQLPAQAIERLRPSPIGRCSASLLRRPSPAQGGRSPQPQRSDSHRSQRPQSRLPHPSHSSAPISSLLAAERARGPPTCHTATLVVLLVSAPRAPSLRAAIAGSFSVSRSGRLATGRNRRLRTYACPAYPTTCLAPRSHSPSSDTASSRAAALVVASPHGRMRRSRALPPLIRCFRPSPPCYTHMYVYRSH